MPACAMNSTAPHPDIRGSSTEAPDGDVYTCPLCEAGSLGVLDSTGNLCECKRCGYVFNNPRPTLAALSEQSSSSEIASTLDPYYVDVGFAERWEAGLYLGCLILSRIFPTKVTKVYDAMLPVARKTSSAQTADKQKNLRGRVDWQVEGVTS